MTKTISMAVAGTALLAACAGPAPPGETGNREAHAREPAWVRVAADRLDPGQRNQLERALAARNAMAETLMGELSAELAEGGPSGAVVVCRDLAPMIADHVADEHGVAIGRTSHRLRNPDNTAPGWAAPMVDEMVADDVVLVGPDGDLGVLLPIRVAPPCLQCHGRRASLDDAVVAALDESYPDDEAVGFAAGDLRGWFWVEVPGA